MNCTSETVINVSVLSSFLVWTCVILHYHIHRMSSEHQHRGAGATFKTWLSDIKVDYCKSLKEIRDTRKWKQSKITWKTTKPLWYILSCLFVCDKWGKLPCWSITASIACYLQIGHSQTYEESWNRHLDFAPTHLTPFSLQIIDCSVGDGWYPSPGKCIQQHYTNGRRERLHWPLPQREVMDSSMLRSAENNAIKPCCCTHQKLLEGWSRWPWMMAL